MDGGERVISLNLILQVGVVTYNRLFTSESTVLIEHAEVHFDSAEWAVSFKTLIGKETSEECIS